MNESRKYIIQIAFLIVPIIFLGRLFSIQVLDSHYKVAAENNIISRVIEYPHRGLIYDRNHQLLVHNTPVYDLMVVPKDVDVPDTAAFCDLLHIDKEGFQERLQKARKYSYVKPSPFFKQLSNKEFGQIEDKLVNYKGFYVNARTIRHYPDTVLANEAGYIGEISPRQLKRDTTNYYQPGDYIGISGLESYYEPILRGKRGVKYRMVNVKGIQKGSFKNGQYDTLATPGANLESTIDLDLQKYGEYLMDGKVGSVVAIEPKTGEILAMVSSPTYDPNKLAGRKFSENFSKLQQDTLDPLYNRPIQALYRPGSVFKLVQSLVAMQEGVVTPQTTFLCDHSLIKCHGNHGRLHIEKAIQFSCNPFFYQVFRREIQQGNGQNLNKEARQGLKEWDRYVSDFGFGHPLGVDLPHEKGGMIPDSSYYDRYYGKYGWNFYTIYSLSIGEGELLITPIQIANLGAIIANKGYYITPHLVKKVITPDSTESLNFARHDTGIDSSHFNIVIDAMSRIVEGTAPIAKTPDITICGKTGTVQNKNQEDHSAFMAFAPKENPQIAISVYVEHGRWGGGAAAAIAGLMIEKYLKGHISPNKKWVENYVLKKMYLN